MKNTSSSHNDKKKRKKKKKGKNITSKVYTNLDVCLFQGL